MTTEHHCGLFAKNQAIPLEGVRIEAKLCGPCVDVTVTQRFRNTESVPVEAVYVFPLEEAAAVCGFEARLGNDWIRGRVEEREKAFAAYDDAMIAGNSAFLLDQERPNVFTASVGNLAPGDVAELRIRYVALARREGAAWRLGIPTTVSPRYVPATPPSVGQPDGERVNPEHWLAVPYGLTLRVDVDAPNLRRVESPSHPIRTELAAHGAVVELSQESTALDRDFVLLVESASAHQPFARVARASNGAAVAMVSFLPELVPSSDTGHEVVFLLDCSGSMGGVSIQQAKRALALCVRALGPHDTFNIVCFGSAYTSLWSSPRRLDETTLQDASKFIEGIDANLGGTEILAPLAHILDQRIDPARPRRVLVLTDGQVSNEDHVIALGQKHVASTRVFSFGIGAGASEHLVRGLARASRGAAEMIFPGERIEPKVMRMFARVRTPSLDDAHIVWGDVGVEQAPGRTPPIFAGDELIVFARLTSEAPREIELRAGTQSWRVSVDASPSATSASIPALWARERIRELEDAAGSLGSAQSRGSREERVRAQLVELGTRHGLLSSATSYVAVAERADRITAPVELRRIPVALTTGWGGSGMATPMPRSSAAPAGVTRLLASVAPAPRRPAPGEPELSRVMKESQAADAAVMDVMAEYETSGRDVFGLLMTQRADGRFGRSDALEAWLDDDRRANLLTAIAKHGEAVAVTALVIALLAREAADRESEWRPALTKAHAWLAAQGTTLDGATLL